jgi:hypothetical protein
MDVPAAGQRGGGCHLQMRVGCAVHAELCCGQPTRQSGTEQGLTVLAHADWPRALKSLNTRASPTVGLRVALPHARRCLLGHTGVEAARGLIADPARGGAVGLLLAARQWELDPVGHCAATWWRN